MDGKQPEEVQAPARIVIELVDIGGADDPPQGVRLRMLLKRALRTWAFRCVSVAELPAAADADKTAPPAPG